MAMAEGKMDKNMNENRQNKRVLNWKQSGYNSLFQLTLLLQSRHTTGHCVRILDSNLTTAITLNHAHQFVTPVLDSVAL